MCGKIITMNDIKKKYNLDNPSGGRGAGGRGQRIVGIGGGGMSKKQMDALFYFWFAMCILFWFVSPLSGLFVTGFFVIINYRRLKRIFEKYVIRKGNKQWIKMERK